MQNLKTFNLASLSSVICGLPFVQASLLGPVYFHTTSSSHVTICPFPCCLHCWHVYATFLPFQRAFTFYLPLWRKGFVTSFMDFRMSTWERKGGVFPEPGKHITEARSACLHPGWHSSVPASATCLKVGSALDWLLLWAPSPPRTTHRSFGK